MAIKIAGEIEKSLYNCTDLTRKELNKIARAAAYTSTHTKDTFSGGLKETEPFFEGLEKAGVKAFKAVASAAAAAGTAVIGAGTLAANAGIEYESAFAGVKKTTEATVQEYEQMRKEVLSMTREIPAAASEIAEVAEAAGQLGIGKENLLGFSRVMIDLGESTDLASTEAASALAKFSNITNPDMKADDYSRLGSVVVDLGNNFATTESDIVSMATNMASAGELAGFTQAQIMAMATAMSSVGIEAEAGGSSMSKIIKKVQVAVETNSKSLQDYASVAGKSVEEFREDFKEDGLAAIAAFIGGLNDVERNGKSATVILEEMGLTEVRLSNTLLSLANADDLMLRAVETANNAWEENIALSREAATRYETTESKIAIMQNGFTEMGIAMYDQFNEPLREGIDVITELVHEATMDISNSNVIHDIAQNVVDNIPTVISITEQLAVAVGNFAEPFLTVGGWLADNPKVLTSAITGIGMSLASYKVVKGVTSLTSAFKALGPAAMPVLAAAGGIAAVTGLGAYLAQWDAEMTRVNLDEHFGDIALSLTDINEAARQIVGDSYLDKVDELLSAGAVSDSLINSLERAIRDINAERWKLSVGLSFSAEDKEEYARMAQQYISDVQAYISNEGYTFQLSAELLLSGSVNMEDIIADNNAFYTQLGTQMQEIGGQVSDIISEALENGLEIDQGEIERLLGQAQKIQEALSGGESKAKLETIQARYSGAMLDVNSWQNLMQDINNYVTESNEEAWNSYSSSIAKLEARRELDESYTQEQYEADKAEFLQGTYSRQAESALNAYNFLMNTVEDTYGSEINSEYAEKYIQDELDRLMNEGDGNKYYRAQDWSDQTREIITGLSVQADRLGHMGDAATEILEYAAPLQEQIDIIKQHVESNGGELDRDILEMLNAADERMARWKATTGDEESMWKMIGNAAGENEDYAVVLMAAQKNGAAIAQEAIDAIREKQPEAEQIAQEFLETSKQVLEGGYDATVPINVGYKYVSEYNNTGKIYGIANNADGGIITSPTISWLAEGGYAESVIPLDGSQNAVNLWQQTGEMLGVFRKDGFHSLATQLLDEPNGGSISNAIDNSEEKISINPVFEIHVNGEAGNTESMEKSIRSILNGELREIVEEVLEKRARDRKRFSFS
jgi:TP901 family phage tail tape measure protein